MLFVLSAFLFLKNRRRLGINRHENAPKGELYTMNTQDTVHRKSAAELRIRRVMDALEKNNMQAYYAPRVRTP